MRGKPKPLSAHFSLQLVPQYSFLVPRFSFLTPHLHSETSMPIRTLKPLAIALALALPQAQASAAEAAKPVYDVHDLDSAISACQDFNGYANGKWIAANPIPADRTRWGAFDQLREHSLDAQHKHRRCRRTRTPTRPRMARSSRRSAGSTAPAWTRRAIDKAGFDPIKPDLATIARIDDTRRHRRLAGRCLREGRRPGLRFRFRHRLPGRDAPDRVRRPGRTRPADAGLLQQG